MFVKCFLQSMYRNDYWVRERNFLFNTDLLILDSLKRDDRKHATLS